MLFAYTQRIFFEDVDSSGVVHHVNYLKFMERARSEWLRTLGYTLSSLAEQDIYFVIRKAELNFLKPIFLDAMIEITIALHEPSTMAPAFLQTIRDPDHVETVYCRGVVQMVCVNKMLRPRKIDLDLKNYFV